MGSPYEIRADGTVVLHVRPGTSVDAVAAVGNALRPGVVARRRRSR